MKRIIYFLLLPLFYTNLFAQEQMVNTVSLSTKSGDTIGTTAISKALIAVKDGTQDFKAIIELFPIVPNPDAEDSLEQKNKPLVLKLQGHFPVSNMDFLTVADNGKTYSMELTARVNDSVQNITVSFALIILLNEPANPNGNLPKYTARMNFAFVLPPKLFGLNASPFNINKLILVQASEAVISKLDLNYPGLN